MPNNEPTHYVEVLLGEKIELRLELYCLTDAFLNETIEIFQDVYPQHQGYTVRAVEANKGEKHRCITTSVN